MRHTVLTSCTLLWSFVKIFHTVTYLWYAQGKSKISSKGRTQKLRKGEQTFMYLTHRLNLIHIAVKFHLDIPYGYLVMAHTMIVWKKKSNQREVTQKVRKGEQPFLHATRRLDLIHIVMKVHQNIPYGYLAMARTRIVYARRTDGQPDNVIT